ncbi:hypothetical protein [Nesterenkonia halotolerans]|uniref:Uncharacterized protein n=1 Tax=Nesterenkonia halotolerans TaxID=225325 RepID=A0ABR9J657_9MICC|nr:hypothetical protein [Nesterenkonia halotolerans]MBE1514468.1 hypothetical protein [Nesterenkonia halotolerans]
MPDGSEQDLLGWELYLTRLESWAAQLGHPAAQPQAEGRDGEGPDQSADVLSPESPLSGPLPGELQERARAVLDSLNRASERTRMARLDVGRQLSALRQVPPRDSGEARYLDTSG